MNMLLKLVCLVCVITTVFAYPRERSSPSEQKGEELQAEASNRQERQAGGHHHDAVDFGAHTGNHGAFGWHADFPVHTGH